VNARTLTCATLLLAVGLFSACEYTEREPDPKNKVAILADAPQEHDYSKKSEYLSLMNTKMTKNKEELEKLTEKVADSTSDAKANASLKLEDARTKMALTNKRLQQAEQSPAGQWAEMEQSIKASYEDTNKALNETRQWISENI
jgi:hypothetical protein